MNEASRWRLMRAREIAPIYLADPRVAAVMVGGSVARGCADRYSDVEVGLFWEEFPEPEAFRAAMERARGTDWELDPCPDEEGVWYEEYAVDGLKIDLRHMRVAGMSDLLTAVVDRGDGPEERQQILSAVQHGVPLHGEALLDRWRATAARYPESLARAMARRHLALNPWWSVAMLAERGDLHLVYGAFSRATEAIFGALLGVNRLYHPGSKWLEQTLASFRICPPDLGPRLRRLFRSEPLDGAQQMEALIEETFDLAEAELADAEIAAARAGFRSRRSVLDLPAARERA
jgi:predicted nucleotidyltransferase